MLEEQEKASSFAASDEQLAISAMDSPPTGEVASLINDNSEKILYTRPIPIRSSLGNSSIRNRGATKSRHVDSKPIYNAQPPWGWDYCFVIKAPTFSDAPVANPEPSADLSAQLAANLYSQSSDDVRSSPNVIVSKSPESIAVGLDDGSSSCFATDKDDPDVIEATKTRLDIIARLQSAGFTFSQLYVPTERSIYLRVGLSNETMKEKAEHLGMELPLKASYGSGYMAFSPTLSSVYQNDENSPSYFLPADRILIILGTLQSKEEWGCGLNIEKLVFKKKVMQGFAVHSLPEQDKLVQDVVWARVWCVLSCYIAAQICYGDANANAPPFCIPHL
jgi:hypothetical protein